MLKKKNYGSLVKRALYLNLFKQECIPHADLYSHIIGQTDYDNYGISGVENFYDKY